MRRLKSLWTEKVEYKLGALLDSFTYTMFWLSLVGFATNMMTGYVVWVNPAINIQLRYFFLGILVIIGIGMALEYFVLYKARQHFRNKWEYSNESPIQKDLKANNEKIDQVKEELLAEIRSLKENLKDADR